MIKSWRLARPEDKFFRVLSLSLGFLAFALCFGLYLQSDGMDQATLEVSEQYAKASGLTFSQPIPRVYELLADQYLALTSWLLVFLLGKSSEGLKWFELFRRKLIFQIIAFSSLGMAVFSLGQVFYWKYKLSLTDYWVSPLYSLLKSSIPLDWICLALIFLLLVIQLFAAFQNFSNENEFKV